MSSDVGTAGRGGASRAARRRARLSRGFAVRVLAVVGVLAVAAVLTGVLTTVQGPRVTAIESDPAAAVASAGSRIIFTTTQSLEEVAPEQVSVTPATEFTVDTSGRSVGVRFTLPLWDETTYTVRIDDLRGLGGGPAGSIEETFTTPPLQAYILQRGADTDTIFRVDLTGDGVPVFEHPHIEDFRATAARLVVSTLEDDVSRLIVTRADGSDPQEMALPGEGIVANLQSAETGNTIGYTFTDADISADRGRESLLFTGSTADPDAAPQPVERAGEARVEDWRFVPGTDSILMLTFDGALTLVAPGGGDAVSLGNAIGISDISGTSAYVDRVEGPVVIELATAEEEPLSAAAADLGQLGSLMALPGGGTLQALTPFDGLDALDTTLTRVSPEGETSTLATVAAGDALLQTCIAPSGRYAALVVAPEAVSNPYDGYLLPLPERLETRIVSFDDGAQVVPLAGFDLSWCRRAPSL